MIVLIEFMEVLMVLGGPPVFTPHQIDLKFFGHFVRSAPIVLMVLKLWQIIFGGVAVLAQSPGASSGILSADRLPSLDKLFGLGINFHPTVYNFPYHPHTDSEEEEI